MGTKVVVAPEPALRPTRDAFAPTTAKPPPAVPAPPPPRVAPAPRVVAERLVAASVDRARARDAEPAVARALALADAKAAAPAPPGPLVLVRVTNGDDARIANVLRARGLRVRVIGTPRRRAGFVRELERSGLRAASLGTASGGVGAFVGALAIHREALLPAWGWLPGPLVGASLGAVSLGCIGIVAGALASLLDPVRDPVMLAIEGGADLEPLVGSCLGEGVEIVGRTR